MRFAGIYTTDGLLYSFRYGADAKFYYICSVKLSLIIATYNRAPHLLRALESAVRQTADPSSWECVVVNNNSTDSTAADFAVFAAAHPQFRLRMVDEPKQGLSNARNCGIRNSSGEIVAIIDDDETLVQEYIANYIRFFETYPEASVAGGGVVPRYETARPKWMSPYPERMIANPIDFGSRVREFPKSRVPAGGNMAFRREVFVEFGMFDPELGRNGKALTGGEETDLFARLRAGGKRLYYVPHTEIFHHIPADKLTRERFDRQCFDVGRSKYVRAESCGEVQALLADERRKRVFTFVLAAYYLLTFRPQKAEWLVAMRRGISAGIAAQGERM